MGYGIKVNNPLSNRVRVEVIDGNTILRSTVMEPGTTKFIGLEKKGTYDVRTTILHRVVGAIDEELGPAGFLRVTHEDVEELEAVPVSKSASADLENRFWRDIVIWKIDPGKRLTLRVVEVNPNDIVSWRLKISKPGDGKNGGKALLIGATTSINDLDITAGHIVKLQARSDTGVKVTASGRLSGLETVIPLNPVDIVGIDLGKKTTSPPSKGEPDDEVEEKEIVVRSMSDIFEELRKKEVPA